MAVFKSTAHKAGVLYPDWPVIVDVGRDSSVSWSFKSNAQAAARKFQELGRMALEPYVPNLAHTTNMPSTDIKAAAGQFAARLVFLDGVRLDVLDTIGKSFSVYRYSEGVCIEWEEPSSGQIERRLLSTPTTAIWSEILLQLELNPAPVAQKSQGTGGIEPVANDYTLPLSKGLEHWLQSRFVLAVDVPTLKDLAGWQAAWMAQILPGPLFAHTTGALTLGALPRSTLARLASGKALRSQGIEGTEEAPQEMVLDQILDLMSEVEGGSIDRPLLETALDCLKTQHASGIAGNTRRLWATKLADLDLNRRSVNRQTIVLISWMAHMCEAGTIGRPQAAVQTIKAYAGRVLIPLAETLADKGLSKQDPQDWEPEALLDVYREVVDRMSSGSREVAKTALANFHWYLQSVLDLGYLPTTISSSVRAQPVGGGEDAEHAEHAEDAEDSEGAEDVGGEEEPEGDDSGDEGEDAGDTERQKGGALKETLTSWLEAEVIWEHEIRWCIEACAAEKDARLGEIGALMLSIARENPVRHQDLTRITMRNVAAMDLASGPAYEIEVSRDARHGSLKSESSQRRLVIREPETVARMANWLTQRKREGAQPTEFLFGEPGGQLKRYRSAAAHSLVNRLLKVATGNPRARLHHLRHTVISRKVAEILTSCTTVDVGPLDLLAAQAGHGSPLTTLRTYTHQYEQPLRLWLDIGLRAYIPLTAAESGGAYDEAIGSFERLSSTRLMDSEPAGENDNGADSWAATGPNSTRGETGRSAKKLKGAKGPRSLKPNSLVQAALRRNRPLNEYGWERLNDLLPPVCLPTAQEAFAWVGRELPEKVDVPRPITYSAAAEILKSLANRKEVATVAYIHRLDQGVVEASLSQLDVWLVEVHLKLFPRSQVPQSRTPSYQRERILDNLAVSLTQMRHGIWGVWAECFEAPEGATLMDDVVNDWVTHSKGRYLPLSDGRRTRRLIQVLTQGGLGRDEIRVVVQSEDPSSSTSRSDNTASHASTLGMIREMFLRELDLAPRVEFTKARKDRPAAYLRINPYPGKANTPGKADLTTALKGWLVAWRFFRLLQNNARTI